MGICPISFGRPIMRVWVIQTWCRILLGGWVHDLQFSTPSGVLGVLDGGGYGEWT